MARHKEFDREEVLDRAMDLFWRRGYEATSVRDLVDHLGIGQGSIYGTFGDKHALFLEALDRYRRTQDPQLASLLEGPGSVKDKLRVAFEGLVEESTCEGGRRGCFMVNSAVEMAPCDPQTAKRVKANAAGAQGVFGEALVRAREAGEIPPDRDPRALARFLFNAVQGLRVMARAGARKEVMDDVVEVTLSVLD
jgi:TetR/AcrR family transcriptional repressor of nem operon